MNIIVLKKSLVQHYIKLRFDEKDRQVIELLNTLAFNQIVIFVKSVRRCSAACKLLTKQKFVVTKIHCEMPHEEYFVYL
jgi:ATP-dependent RNA helicase UAP56/SUB2